MASTVCPGSAYSNRPATSPQSRAFTFPRFSGAPASLQFSEHVIGDGGQFHRHACKMALEGIVSKRIDRPYAPGDRGIWRKTKCLNREEFVVVGWTEPEGARPYIGALLLG